MKRLVEKPVTVEKEIVVEKVTKMESVLEESATFDHLLGKEVCIICTSYIYHGRLTGVNVSCLELSEPNIVYQTGDWSAKKWEDAQSLGTPSTIIHMAQIECGPFEVSKK